MKNDSVFVNQPQKNMSPRSVILSTQTMVVNMSFTKKYCHSCRLPDALTGSLRLFEMI